MGGSLVKRTKGALFRAVDRPVPRGEGGEEDAGDQAVPRKGCASRWTRLLPALATLGRGGCKRRPPVYFCLRDLFGPGLIVEKPDLLPWSAQKLCLSRIAPQHG